MGLMSFWKKKSSDQIALPPLDNPSLSTDLPSIDGSLIGEGQLNTGMNAGVSSGSSQPFGELQQLPSLDMPQQSDNLKAMSINLPTLEFSMPAPDDASMIDAPPKPQDQLSDTKTVQDAMQGINAAGTTNIATTLNSSGASIDFEDINNLFVSDGWTEPDWTTFEPYTEEMIDEPKPEDFKGADLPKFDDADTDLVVYPTSPFEEKSHKLQKPVELFIRGRAYNSVFIELDQMNKSLSKIDMQFTSYEDIIKNEEPLLITAKEQMEYLYKRLNQIDKKIFAQ